MKRTCYDLKVAVNDESSLYGGCCVNESVIDCTIGPYWSYTCVAVSVGYVSFALVILNHCAGDNFLAMGCSCESSFCDALTPYDHVVMVILMGFVVSVETFYYVTQGCVTVSYDTFPLDVEIGMTKF